MNFSSKLTLSCLMLSLLAGCGKAPDDALSKNSNPSVPGNNVGPVPSTPVGPEGEVIPEPLGETNEGSYTVDLWRINAFVTDSVSPGGKAAFVKEGDTFKTYVKFLSATPGTGHRQAIYSGRCPNFNTDDLNNDKFVDAEEAAAVLGKVLIPLDKDLSTQQAGKNFYPISNQMGKYFYEQSTSFDQMMGDLKVVDENPNDLYMKLGPDGDLSLIGKAVVIMGVSESTVLPPSARGIHTFTAHQALPVACGNVIKVETLPEEYTTDDTAEPVPTPVPVPTEPTDPTTPIEPIPTPGPTPIPDPTTPTEPIPDIPTGPTEPIPDVTPEPVPVPVPVPTPVPDLPEVEPLPEIDPVPAPRPTPEPRVEEDDEDDNSGSRRSRRSSRSSRRWYERVGRQAGDWVRDIFRDF